MVVRAGKAAAAAMLQALIDLSEPDSGLNQANILLILISNHREHGQNLTVSLPEISAFVTSRRLNLKLALDCRPFPGTQGLREPCFFTDQLGQVEFGFYILGESAPYYAPFQGFSATLIAAALISRIELNSRLPRLLGGKRAVPAFHHLHLEQKPHCTPEAVNLNFILPCYNLPLDDLTEMLKDIAGEVIEQISSTSDERELNFRSRGGNDDFLPDLKEAEVISFADLLSRAQRNSPVDLNDLCARFAAESAERGLNDEAAAQSILKYLTSIVKLPRPSIIVYLGRSYLPQQGLRTSSNYDRECMMLLHKAEQSLRTAFKPVRFERGFAPNENCGLRPIGLNAALQALEHDCPLPLGTFYSFSSPVITLALPSRGIHTPFEHVSFNTLNYIGATVYALLAVMQGSRLEISGIDEEIPAAEDEDADPGNDDTAREPDSSLQRLLTGSLDSLPVKAADKPAREEEAEPGDSASWRSRVTRRFRRS